MTDVIIKEAFDKLAGPKGDLPLCKLRDLMESLGIDHQQFKGQNCKRQVRDLIGSWDIDSDRFLSWKEFQEGPMMKIKELLESA